MTDSAWASSTRGSTPALLTRVPAVPSCVAEQRDQQVDRLGRGVARRGRGELGGLDRRAAAGGELLGAELAHLAGLLRGCAGGLVAVRGARVGHPLSSTTRKVESIPLNFGNVRARGGNLHSSLTIQRAPVPTVRRTYCRCRAIPSGSALEEREEGATHARRCTRTAASTSARTASTTPSSAWASSAWSRCSPRGSSPHRHAPRDEHEARVRSPLADRRSGHGRPGHRPRPHRWPHEPVAPCAGADDRAAGPAPARGRQLGGRRRGARGGRATAPARVRPVRRLLRGLRAAPAPVGRAGCRALLAPAPGRGRGRQPRGDRSVGGHPHARPAVRAAARSRRRSAPGTSPAAPGSWSWPAAASRSCGRPRPLPARLVDWRHWHPALPTYVAGSVLLLIALSVSGAGA